VLRTAATAARAAATTTAQATAVAAKDRSKRPQSLRRYAKNPTLPISERGFFAFQSGSLIQMQKVSVLRRFLCQSIRTNQQQHPKHDKK
jgi:hypothetical protein